MLQADCVQRKVASTVKWFLITVVAGGGLVGCGGPADSIGEYTPAEPADPQALQVESATSCRIDADCQMGRFCHQEGCVWECKEDGDCASGESCSRRGMCRSEMATKKSGLGPDAGEASAEADQRPPQVLNGLSVTARPDTDVEIGPEQKNVTLSWELDGETPAGGVPYRVERSDGRSDPAQLRHSDPGTAFAVDLAPGKASPGAEQSGRVAVTIRSAVGTFNVMLRPKPAWAGTWTGQVTLDSLGGQELPLEVWVSGQAPDNLKIGLPVGPEHLFSPREAIDGRRDFEVQPLKWNDKVEAYQARFVHRYQFSSGAFAEWPATQIRRTIRLDVERQTLERGQLRGRMKDVWSGIYQDQSRVGVRTVGEMSQWGGFEVERSSDLPVEAEAMTVKSPREVEPDEELAAAEPTTCDSSNFDVPETTSQEGGFTWNCAGIDSVESFVGKSAIERVDCAMAVALEARSGTTTSDQLQSYFAEESEGDPEAKPELSFKNFVKACADPNDTACQPLADAPCATDLLAHGARGLRSQNVEEPDTLNAYQTKVAEEMKKMASEAYLARQLGAFHTDLATRRSWLETSTAPKTFLRQVEKKSQQMLQAWRDDVLEAQAGMVAEFFDRNALVVMGRPVQGNAAGAARRQLLMQGGMLWRSTVGAMSLAARRWDRRVRDDEMRREAMSSLGRRALKMYVVMGLLKKFNNSAGAAGQSALLVGNFADMMENIGRLGRSFDASLFARDAEVVTATSLNPLADNTSLLSRRRSEAKETVESVRTDIEELLKEMQAQALDEAATRGKLQRKRTEAAQDIAALCGLPKGCSVDNLASKAETCLNVEAGVCGLNEAAEAEPGTTIDLSKVKASKAGSRFMDILESYQNLKIAASDLDGHLRKAELDYQELRAFKEDIDAWNQKRLDAVKNLQSKLAEMNKLEDKKLQTLVDNLAERAAARQSTIERKREQFSNWNRIRIEGKLKSLASQLAELGIRKAADKASAKGQGVADKLRAEADGLPDYAGMSNDAAAPAVGRLKSAASVIRTGTGLAATAMNYAADAAEIQRKVRNKIRKARLLLMGQTSDLKDLIGDDQLAGIKGRMKKANQLSDNQVRALKRAVEIAKSQREAELAYRRDFAEFRERRKAYKQKLVDTGGLRMRQRRAEFQVLQNKMEYWQVLQEAKLEAARFREINGQLKHIDSLYGAPSVVFLRFQELRQAERRLDEARRALMDWLVTLEYYAVRPFIAERIKILLARNAYDMQAIVTELEDIEDSCGGSERSTASVSVSVRDDLMELDLPQQDGQQTLSAAERFRENLSTGYVPTDRSIRYSTEVSLEETLQKEGILTTSFSLRPDKFANLPNACNAKLGAMSMKLEGDIGDGQPSVTLLYDGAAQLRSCQPDITETVQSFGQGLTNYGETTYLRAEGRSATPVASIGAFPGENTGKNKTLAGLPLASQYTVLIDTNKPANEGLDWSKLEDIEIQLDYTYNDLFPEACN